jgi:hypothetical protein
MGDLWHGKIEGNHNRLHELVIDDEWGPCLDVSDGECGLLPIQYCPFCGQKIEVNDE